MRLIVRTLLLKSLLLVAACSSQPTATDAKKLATAIGHIRPSQLDTCDTQKQIAAQSSKIDTIKKGKETVYKAKCEG